MNRKRGYVLLQGILIVLIILIGFMTSACTRKEHKKINLSILTPVQAVNSSTNRQGPPLRVAVAAVVSPRETLKGYQELFEYLSTKMGRPVEIIQGQTYAETNERLRSGNIDLAIVCSGAYVEGNRDFGMELLVAPRIKGQTFYRSVIIVPYDSEAQDIFDLKGKVFAFTDPMSYSGWIAPTHMLYQKGVTPEAFFQKSIFTYSHDNSIKAVADKLVDGAAVDSLVFEYTVTRNPEYNRKIKIIGYSEPVGNPPIVINPQLDENTKKRLKDVFLTMHEDEQGRRALANLLIDSFFVPDDHAYDPVREMIRKMRPGR